ncbi:hypothetical protein [Sphingomonas sp.]|uniref:hypothetical protein n=1 Tax=Sphingomonas sp. TaxID=28214 RepID=UPI00286A400F|nr:hypothetical protein [Sphingomonas sp.]
MAVAAVAAVAIPALAQDNPESILPPGFGDPAPAPSQTPTPAPKPDSETRPAESSAVVETGLSGLTPSEAADAMVVEIAPPIELPDDARRDPSSVGPLPAAQTGFGDNPWGRSSGKFLSILMRKTDGPLASRWGHILLRNALLTNVRGPGDVNPADWVAERAWLLIRMGEADGARLLVAGVDVADFTPKMYQIAVQSALASADPSALCPIEDGLRKVERNVAPLVRAMCASLSGNSAIAAADVEAARRRGRFDPIDLALADKVVGAGADTARAVTIEWKPVKRLNAWRFGLATATGMEPPAALIGAASPQLRAWQARAPMLSAEQRLASARIATGLGVFSSQALIDLYAQIYDLTDASDLGQTDAWQVRLAVAGKNQDDKIAAIRKLLDSAKGSTEREATRALLARAAQRIPPDAELQEIAPELISAMLAGGFDREAARWVTVVNDMDDQYADRCWAMLALGAPTTQGIDLGGSRVADFIKNDASKDKQRSALLVAGLAGLGRISTSAAGQLSARYELGLGGKSVWTRTIDGASVRDQAGTVALLAAVGMQAPGMESVPGYHLFHLITALNRNGQAFAARMIAAEALSRT